MRLVLQLGFWAVEEGGETKLFILPAMAGLRQDPAPLHHHGNYSKYIL